jgi:hypothetical protein
MEYPTSQEDLVCELEGFLHLGVLNEEGRAFFNDFIQGDFREWMDFCEDHVFTDFFSQLHNFLSVGAQLYVMEDLGNLVVGALSARRHVHQMCLLGQEVDTSDTYDELSAFLQNSAQVLKETDDLDKAIPKEKVMEFLCDTPNKYLLINLMLCVLKDDYKDSYQEYIKGKISRFTYTLAFWRPMGNLFKPDVPTSQLLWMDIFGDLTGPKPSNRQFQQMMRQTEE